MTCFLPTVIFWERVVDKSVMLVTRKYFFLDSQNLRCAIIKSTAVHIVMRRGPSVARVVGARGWLAARHAGVLAREFPLFLFRIGPGHSRWCLRCLLCLRCRSRVCMRPCVVYRVLILQKKNIALYNYMLYIVLCLFQIVNHFSFFTFTMYLDIIYFFL